jgi:RHS repeat-associated protein
VYMSNETPTLVDVYFDDITMTRTPSNVVQYNEYYPFGLTTANSWTRENTTKNNFLYNGGTELNPVSNLYDLAYRNYDPALGRMNGVDPMASKYVSLTPYNFSFNDPVTFNDPTGADPHNDWLAEQNALLDWFLSPPPMDPGGGGSSGGSGYYSSMGDYGVAGAGMHREFGMSMSFGALPYSAAGRAYGAQMHIDAQSMSTERYASKYGEAYELKRVWNLVDDTPFDDNGAILVSDFEWVRKDNKGWLVSSATVALAFMSADLSIPDPTDAALPKWIGYGATAAIAGGVLYFNGGEGNENYPGPWSYTKPDPTKAFYNSSGNSKYEQGDPDGLPPEVGLGIGAALGALKLIQDRIESRDRIEQYKHTQDATKYVIPRLGPK